MTIFKYRECMSSVCRKSLMTTGVQKNIMNANHAQEAELLLETAATAGVITLNRPKHLNIFTHNAWPRILAQLQAWEPDRSHVIVRAAGNKAFCAGGDIKWLFSLDRDPLKYAFIRAMANAIYLISKYRIPYIALMNGMAFGGGLGLAAHARYRIATERAVLAMPETRIGWLTDASAPYFLPRLNKHLGFYMALTGKRLTGKDAVIAGLATHFVPSARLQELETELFNCDGDDIESHLNTYSEPLGEFSLASIIEDIDYCFSAVTVEGIIERLRNLNNSWSFETIETLSQMCPMMLKVSLRALQRGKVSDLKQSLRTEHRVLSRCIGSYNAQEGARALVVDKCNRPQWQPASLAEVTDGMVESYFNPLPVEEELTFFDE